MVKVILKGGVFIPSGPLPAEWQDGMELQVDQAAADGQPSAEEWDQWAARVQAAADEVDPEDVAIILRTTRRLRDQDREHARKEAQRG